MTELIDFLLKYGGFIGIPLLFLIIVAYIYRPKARSGYDNDAKIPFENGNDEQP